MLISRKIIKTMLYISLNCKIILNCSTQFYKIKKKKTEEIKKTPYKQKFLKFFTKNSILFWKKTEGLQKISNF